MKIYILRVKLLKFVKLRAKNLNMDIFMQVVVVAMEAVVAARAAIAKMKQA